MEHEFRAMELAEMMPSQHAVQLAIKYASRLRMLQLAQTIERGTTSINYSVSSCFILHLKVVRPHQIIK